MTWCNTPGASNLANLGIIFKSHIEYSTLNTFCTNVTNALYILNEPTTGLHTADVQRLIEVLQKLVDEGNTVAVIEHNMQIIQAADFIIDLGPEGGNAGVRVVAMGSPKELLTFAQTSHTAPCFEKYLKLSG